MNDNLARASALIRQYQNETRSVQKAFMASQALSLIENPPKKKSPLDGLSPDLRKDAK